MLDLKYVIDNIAQIQENCMNRRVGISLDNLPKLVLHRNHLISESDKLRSEQKKLSKLGSDPTDRLKIKDESKRIKSKISAFKTKLSKITEEINDILEVVPNISHPDAPVGSSDEDNYEVEIVGKPTSFDFPPKDHVEIANSLDLVDFESGSHVAGSNFYFLKNEAVILELGLIRYALDILGKQGFKFYSTPDLARSAVMMGTGYSPRGNETQIYSIQGHDLCLIATSEITLGGILRNKAVRESELPIKMAGVSHCFRTEAGAHGKASKGLYRVHQFTKVEMFIFSMPSHSDVLLEEMVNIEKMIFSGLEIPFRVVDCCTGDLGGAAYRKYDLEAWMPGRGNNGEWGEVTSASNCTDYQSRRLGAKFKPKNAKKNILLHTLNGTAIAISRALIALLENHQQKDGSIIIPKKLQPYVGFNKIPKD